MIQSMHIYAVIYTTMWYTKYEYLAHFFCLEKKNIHLQIQVLVEIQQDDSSGKW